MTCVVERKLVSVGRLRKMKPVLWRWLTLPLYKMLSAVEPEVGLVADTLGVAVFVHFGVCQGVGCSTVSRSGLLVDV